MFEDIAKSIKAHESERKKVAAIHFNVLLNADRLRDVDAKRFCDSVGIPDTYAIEFRKMIKLSEYMHEAGYHLVRV